MTHVRYEEPVFGGTAMSRPRLDPGARTPVSLGVVTRVRALPRIELVPASSLNRHEFALFADPQIRRYAPPRVLGPYPPWPPRRGNLIERKVRLGGFILGRRDGSDAAMSCARRPTSDDLGARFPPQ